MLNITNIPAPRVPFLDERTGLMSREWYRFFLNLFILTGSGSNPTTLEELQLGPPNPQDLTELLIQINQNVAPQYEDQSGDFLATLDTAQLMSMMSRFENAEAAIQGAYLQPVVQTGTIANYNLDSSPTAGGVAYGTGPALAVSAAGTVGQVLTSGGAGAPTWTTDAGGSVTSVAALTLGTTGTDLSSTVANGTTTPVITLQVPTASASNRGALSAADWTAFNNKVTMTYPGAGIPNSTGSAWGTSYSTTGSGTVVALATSPSITTPTLVGNVTMSTGNLIVGTSGMGIDFSATPGTGTSELFSDYEEGTWTPARINFTEVLGGGSITSTGIYTKVGNVVHLHAQTVCAGGATIAGTANTSYFTGQPFTSSSGAGGIWVDTTSGGVGGMWLNTGNIWIVSTTFIAGSTTMLFDCTYTI